MKGRSERLKLIEKENLLSQAIPSDSISSEEGIFLVKSIDKPGTHHVVDLLERSCRCFNFQSRLFCKHLYRCLELFPAAPEPVVSPFNLESLNPDRPGQPRASAEENTIDPIKLEVKVRVVYVIMNFISDYPR